MSWRTWEFDQRIAAVAASCIGVGITGLLVAAAIEAWKTGAYAVAIFGPLAFAGAVLLVVAVLVSR